MNKVIEMNSRKDYAPRAPLIRAKLEGADQALAALESEIGPIACDEAEGKAGAAAKMLAVNNKINAAQAERGQSCILQDGQVGYRARRPHALLGMSVITRCASSSGDSRSVCTRRTASRTVSYWGKARRSKGG